MPPSPPLTFIGIVAALARLATSATSTVSVTATDVPELAQKLHLNRTCAAYVNADPQGKLESGAKLLVPVTCCESSCQGPLCGQRIECDGDALYAEPTATDSTAISVVVQGEDADPGDPSEESETADGPKTTVVDGETRTLHLSSTLLVQSTTNGAMSTLDPTSLSVEIGPVSSAGHPLSSETASEVRPTILIGGSEIRVPSSSTTVTDAHGGSLTLGPPRIIMESSTMAFPAGPTTLSTAALTITFGESAVEPPQNGITTEASVTSAGTSATQSIDPVSVSSPNPTTVPPRETPGPGIAVVIDQQSYLLPETGSVDLLQPDGSTVTLFPDAIVSGSQTVSADPVLSQTHPPLGDLTLETGPAPEGSPETNGASGFDGLINALDNLSGTASSIVDTLGQIDDLGTQWAAGSMSNSEFATSVGPLFDSVVPTLSKFEATLRSALRQFSGPTKELTQDGWRRVFQARTVAQEGFDLSSSLDKLIRSLSWMKNRTIDIVQNHWGKGATGVALVAHLGADLDRFAAYDWRREKSPASSTTSTNSTEAVRPTRRSTSTSASSTATAVPYLLSSKPGTDPVTFDGYLATVSEDVHREDKYPDIPWQSQILNLTAKQAQEALKQPFMDVVILITEPPEEPDINPSFDRTTANVVPRAVGDFDRRENSDEHLKLISSGPYGVPASDILGDYLYDPILGKGQTIYIIDEGFNIRHAELAPGNRRVTSKFFPTQVYLPNVPIQYHAPEGIDTHTGHGTHVASIAGGVNHGVAPNADLVLVKIKHAARSEFTGHYTNRQITPVAIDEVWYWIIQDILEKRRNGNTGKFIVNWSGGVQVKSPEGKLNRPFVSRLVERALELCWQNDIITVVAAGNDGEYGGTLDRTTPANHGEDENALITVGGVHIDGKIWPGTTWKKPGPDSQGSISVYALAYQVSGAGFVRSEVDRRVINEATDITTTLDGSSQAAPAVAGLAAYFASLDSLSPLFPPGEVSKRMKEYIVEHAYRRNDNPVPSNYDGKPSPESIIVAYNMAVDGVCSSGRQDRRSVANATFPQSLVRRQDTAEVPVMEDGKIVATSWSKSVCDPPATSSAQPSMTSHSTTTTEEPTVTSETSLPPAPTVNVNHGILTCESATRNIDDDTGYFGLDEMAAARDAFCDNMTSLSDSIAFKPGKNQFVKHVYVPPNNIYHRIRVSAKWVAGVDTDCQPFDFSRSHFISTDGGKYPEDDNCRQRVDMAIQNCDPVRGHKDFWKRGGKFFRNCITWEIGAADGQ